MARIGRKHAFFLALVLAHVFAIYARTDLIQYISERREFRLHGLQSTYAFRIRDGLLEHLYWGSSVDESDNLAYLVANSKSISFDAGEKNGLSLEFADFGTGDYRSPTLALEYNDATNSRISPFTYEYHEIIAGKPSIDKSLPATYLNSEDEAQTLVIHLVDTLTGLRVELYYTVFRNLDVISRQMVVNGQESLYSARLLSVMSCTVDFLAGNDWHMTQLSGAWARERRVVTRRIEQGTTEIGSRRGATSHMDNPFIVLSPDGPTHETRGDHYAFNLVYSGNHIAEVEKVQTGRLRVNMGIHPFNFEWQLAGGERFVTPEVILAYSPSGMGHISRQLHRLYRNNLARGYWRNRDRPILVNSWEAMYFDVSHEKIVERLAKPAANMGIDLVVVDDGWFGERHSDRCCLGDWYVNTQKFPEGLSGLARDVNALGLSLGIWMEPEMISVDSDLYRAHPDWCMHSEGRARTESRNQLVLDLSRSDVRDYIVTSVVSVLKSANISYLKWDFNRFLSEVGSAYFPTGELHHRYVLGLYNVMERITKEFPQVLFESCSGGGGRFDPAMLHYMPQAWTSDNTDAIDRTGIQYGTSLAYPASMMGAHVSVVPNHQNDRVTPFETRVNVAFGGSGFGYELDLSEMNAQDSSFVTYYNSFFRKVSTIIREGDMYRLSDPFTTPMAAWMHVSPTLQSAVVSITLVQYIRVNNHMPIIRLQGLDPNSHYKVQTLNYQFRQDQLQKAKNQGQLKQNIQVENASSIASASADTLSNSPFAGSVLSGKALMHAGLLMQWEHDSDSVLIYLSAVPPPSPVISM